MQGVDAVEVLEGDGHADNGQFGEGGEHARQVGCSPGSGDDDAQAARRGASPVGDHVFGHAVGGDDADLAGDVELGEGGDGGFHGGPVRVGTHDDADEGVVAGCGELDVEVGGHEGPFGRGRGRGGIVARPGWVVG